MLETTSCDCEHVAHFSVDKTPNGNSGHNYGQKFASSYTETIKTPMGSFKVCRDCAKDCYANYRR